jgi:hypothetical protein
MGRSNTVTITVTPAIKSTRLTLVASKTSAPVPAVITFTATLVDSEGYPVVGRNIDFYANGTLVWTVTTDSNGNASVDLGYGNVGTYSVYASFAGDANYGPSTSNTVTVTITKAPTTLALRVSKSEIVQGESVDLIATLVNAAYNIPVIGATVKFYTADGRFVDSKVTDENGVAKTTLTIGVVGTYSYYAVFEGDENHEGC